MTNKTRTIRSVTLTSIAERPPTWARYTVHCHRNEPGIQGTTVAQAFSCRDDAEAFARACSDAMGPMRRGNNDMPHAWVTVNALPARHRSWTNHLCYMAIDPGNLMLKHHKIPAGYGVTGGV